MSWLAVAIFIPYTVMMAALFVLLLRRRGRREDDDPPDPGDMAAVSVPLSGVQAAAAVRWLSTAGSQRPSGTGSVDSRHAAGPPGPRG